MFPVKVEWKYFSVFSLMLQGLVPFLVFACYCTGGINNILIKYIKRDNWNRYSNQYILYYFSVLMIFVNNVLPSYFITFLIFINKQILPTPQFHSVIFTEVFEFNYLTSGSFVILATVTLAILEDILIWDFNVSVSSLWKNTEFRMHD